MPADTTIQLPTSARPSRSGRIALLLSLALNALFIGGFVSALVRHGGGSPPRNNAGAGGLGNYVLTLPPDRNREISRRVTDKRQAMGALISAANRSTTVFSTLS